MDSRKKFHNAVNIPTFIILVDRIFADTDRTRMKTSINYIWFTCMKGANLHYLINHNKTISPGVHIQLHVNLIWLIGLSVICVSDVYVPLLWRVVLQFFKP